jgi:acyl-[acyl-carrier-protein]-phospholipid O-acyltransferase/long-chain-fatty-acid--[acyl-carrier-protein] ligase
VSCWPAGAHAVVALPDARKGQQLLRLTTHSGAEARDLLQQARARGLAEIMVPRSIVAVDALPLLGTGKLDYPALQLLADAWLAEKKPVVEASGEAAAG